MKILFVGDIHTKYGIIERIENIIKTNDDIEKIIFTGDYVDDWNAIEDDNLEILEIIFNLKKNYPDKINLLVGNHEFSYLGYPCSGHINSIKTEKLLQDNLDLLDVIYKSDNFIVSHAGFTNLWVDSCKYVCGYKDFDELIDIINNSFHSKQRNIINFLSVASKTSSGDFITASPLWARPKDHINSMIELPKDQIVGHTPIQNDIKDSMIEILNSTNKIIYIDTFSTYRDGITPVGKQQILIFDNENKTYYQSDLDLENIEAIYTREENK